MSKKSFEETSKTLVEAIELCFDNELWLQGLILIYSSIDIMAWLSLPDFRDKVSGSDFNKWVNRYLLPESNLHCNAEDIWGARCSTLHTGTSESSKSRRGTAKEIFYAVGSSNADGIQGWINFHNEQGCKVAVSSASLLNALQEGIKRFKSDIENDSKQADTVYKRADKFFINIDVPEVPLQQEGDSA